MVPAHHVSLVKMKRFMQPMTGMTYASFLVQMARMSGTYGEKAYPSERQASIWKIVQRLKLAQLQLIIDRLIDDSERPPMVPAFSAAAIPYLAELEVIRKAEIREEIMNLVPCLWCEHRGLIFAKPSERIGPYGDAVFRCPFCRASQLLNLSTKIPPWTNKFAPTWWPRYGNGTLSDPDDVFREGETNPDPVIIEAELMPVEEAKKIVAGLLMALEAPRRERQEDIQPMFDL